jgi:hypothetical protein
VTWVRSLKCQAQQSKHAITDEITERRWHAYIRRAVPAHSNSMI